MTIPPSTPKSDGSSAASDGSCPPHSESLTEQTLEEFVEHTLRDVVSEISKAKRWDDSLAEPIHSAAGDRLSELGYRFLEREPRWDGKLGRAGIPAICSVAEYYIETLRQKTNLARRFSFASSRI